MTSFWLNAVIDVLLFVYVLDCLFMGLVILMQRSKQDGAGTAFGGSAVTEIIGAGSGPLVKATAWAAVIFFVLSITLARLYAMRESTVVPLSSVQQELEKSVAPALPATNAAPAMPVPTSSMAPAVAPIPPASSASTPGPAATPAKTVTTPPPAH